MTIYTKTGDDGTTSVIGGRLPKDDARVEAYGTIDELNSQIGVAIAALDAERDIDLREDLTEIQQQLFDCCSDLATLRPELRAYRITPEHAERLEPHIDHYNAQTIPLEYFILPGGARLSALLHVCRAVARRAERRVITLERETQTVNPAVKIYLNRLSDLCFVMARAANARAGVADVCYARSKKVFNRRPPISTT